MKFLQVRLQSKLRINKNTICRLAHVRLSVCVCVLADSSAWQIENNRTRVGKAGDWLGKTTSD